MGPAVKREPPAAQNKIKAMSLLSPDFHQRARAKRDALLLERRRLQVGAPPAAPQPPPDAPRPEEASEPALSPLGEQPAPEEKDSERAEDVIGDKIVSLKEASYRARGSNSRDAPASLRDVDSEEDLSRLTLDGLKRLAKASSVELPKPLNKTKLLTSLLDEYRREHRRGSSADEEEEEAVSSSCTR